MSIEIRLAEYSRDAGIASGYILTDAGLLRFNAIREKGKESWQKVWKVALGGNRPGKRKRVIQALASHIVTTALQPYGHPEVLLEKVSSDGRNHLGGRLYLMSFSRRNRRDIVGRFYPRTTTQGKPKTSCEIHWRISHYVSMSALDVSTIPDKEELDEALAKFFSHRHAWCRNTLPILLNPEN